MLSNQKSLSTYAASVHRLARALWAGRITSFEFVDNGFTAIRRGLTEAWQDGRDRVKAGPMTDENMLRVQELTQEQAQYLPGLAQFIRAQKESGAKFETVVPRVELWSNAWEQTAQAAMLDAALDERFEWELGATEKHCDDCFTLNKKVYTGRTWERYNLRPRSHSLKCGGWRCDCRLKPTRKPVTPGRPPVDLRGKSLLEANNAYAN